MDQMNFEFQIQDESAKVSRKRVECDANYTNWPRTNSKKSLLLEREEAHQMHTTVWGSSTVFPKKTTPWGTRVSLPKYRKHNIMGNTASKSTEVRQSAAIDLSSILSAGTCWQRYLGVLPEESLWETRIRTEDRFNHQNKQYVPVQHCPWAHIRGYVILGSEVKYKRQLAELKR